MSSSLLAQIRIIGGQGMPDPSPSPSGSSSSDPDAGHQEQEKEMEEVEEGDGDEEMRDGDDDDDEEGDDKGEQGTNLPRSIGLGSAPTLGDNSLLAQPVVPSMGPPLAARIQVANANLDECRSTLARVRGREQASLGREQDSLRREQVLRTDNRRLRDERDAHQSMTLTLQAQVANLQTQLAAANGQVANLQAQLAAANALAVRPRRSTRVEKTAASRRPRRHIKKVDYSKMMKK